MCLFHRWVRVEDVDHSACGACFPMPEKSADGPPPFLLWQAEATFNGGEPFRRCAHSFKVCSKCGKAEGYGSHGKLTVVPDTCKAQVASMRKG